MKNGNSKISSKLIHHLLIGLVILFLIACAVGAKVVINLLHNQAAALVNLKAKEQALQVEQSNLITAKKEVAKYATLEKIAESIVPQDKDQAETVREIVNIAAASQIKLTSISFPTSSLGQPNSSKTVSFSQLTPVKGIPGVYLLPITVDDSEAPDATTYADFYNFLTQLEQNRRTSQVTNLSIQPITDGGLINFSLTINEYIKPR
jgi:cell division protein FtsL